MFVNFLFLFFQYDKEYARIQDLQEFLSIRTFPPANNICI